MTPELAAPPSSTAAAASPRVHVVLCDDDGRPIGTAPRDEVHTHDTPLHRAFSVHLLDDDGRTLLTRRALTKVAWPGVWSNSCCGHPLPGESDEDAVRRRVREELGVAITDLRPALADFRYRAVDASGIVEHEICPVFLARVDPDAVRPDPREVAETAWVPWADVVATARTAPALLSPWSVLQLDALGFLPPELPPGVPTTQPEALTAEATAEAVDALLRTTTDDLVARWAALLPGGDAGPAVTDLARWARDALHAGGKRLRPTMCHWGFVAAGGTAGSDGHDAVVRAGAAIELLHAFALVHDDVMDASATRRGEPTTHVRAQQAAEPLVDTAFGTSMATLVGDLLHVEADRLAADLPDPVLAQWWELSTELVAGQGLDLAGAASPTCTLDHARRVADLKSGAYTIGRPLRLGALAADAGPKTLAALDRYARHLGRAFALRDDVLGLWGDPATTGKPAGDDLREAKPTVLRALAEQRLTDADRDVLARATRLDATDDQVRAALDLLDRSGVRADVEAMITAQAEAALAALGDDAITPTARPGLSDLVHRIAWRQS